MLCLYEKVEYCRCNEVTLTMFVFWRPSPLSILVVL